MLNISGDSRGIFLIPDNYANTSSVFLFSLVMACGLWTYILYHGILMGCWEVIQLFHSLPVYSRNLKDISARTFVLIYRLA